VEEDLIISSQRASRIVEEVRRTDDLRQKFFTLWKKRMVMCKLLYLTLLHYLPYNSLSLTYSTKLSSQLISESQSDLCSPLNGFYYRNRSMFHVERDTLISKVKLKAHIYHDEKKR